MIRTATPLRGGASNDSTGNSPRPARAPIHTTARRIKLPRTHVPQLPRRSHAEIFSQIVGERIDAAGVLRYDDRVKLLRAAGRLGISRFDANVLIASAQHRAGDGRRMMTRESPVREANARSTTPAAPLAARPLSTGQLTTIALIAQAGILLAGWWVLLR